jgi:hypothetical protein
MASRFIFAAFSVALALAIIFAVATTVRHVPSTGAGASVMKVG